MAIKRCKSSFAVHVGGSPRVVVAGTLVDADDPIVRGHEALFEDVETYMSDKADRAARVEQATAAPGERRSVLPAAAAKKAAAKKPERPEPKKDAPPAGGAPGKGEGR